MLVSSDIEWIIIIIVVVVVIFIIITMVLIISSIAIVVIVVQVVNLTRKVVVPIGRYVTHRFIVVVVVLGYGNVSG